MNKNHFYILIIVLLLISNLVLLYYFIQKPKRNLDSDGPKNIVIDRLKFDEQQIISYEKLIDQHRKDIKTNDKKIIELKNELYLLLLDNQELKSDSLTSEIGNIQKNIETIHFKHFTEIKAICTPQQMENFNKLSNELAEIFNRKNRKNNPPK